MLKSGTDFRELSEARLEVGSDAVRVPSARRVEVGTDTVPDAATAEIVEEFEELVGKKMDAVIGATSVALDARFKTIRSSESNVANFVADILREGTGANMTILNSGTLRADRMIGPGSITMRDLVALLPMADETAVVKLKGSGVIKALENGVSQYPRLDGRWPCVSGVRFSFDPEKPVGERIVEGSVYVEGEAAEEEGYVPIALDGYYTVATKAYLANGKDGYTVFKEER